MSFSPASTTNSGAANIGTGYFTTLQEAEHYRTLELLKASATKEKFHIFELEVPVIPKEYSNATSFSLTFPNDFCPFNGALYGTNS